MPTPSSKRMRAFAQEAIMDLTKDKESPWDQITLGWRAEGKAEGKQEALLTILSARGLRVTAAQRKRVEACATLATLDRWIEKAATADSVDEALGPVRAPRKKAAAKQARTATRRRASAA